MAIPTPPPSAEQLRRDFAMKCHEWARNAEQQQGRAKAMIKRARQMRERAEAMMKRNRTLALP